MARAGVIQGTKLWPYDKHQKYVKWFTPLLRKALDNMTVETQKNWGSSIATGLVHDFLILHTKLLLLLLKVVYVSEILVIVAQ